MDALLNGLLTLLVLMAVGAGVYFYLLLKRERSFLPEHLRSAKLVMSEKDIACSFLHGRLDRAYRYQGQLVLLEFKTRSNPVVYPSDIAELSLQAWILKQNGHKVSSVGYVVIVQPKKQSVRRVDLLSEVQCLNLYNRYFALKNNPSLAKKANNAKCKTCGFQAICRKDYE